MTKEKKSRKKKSKLELQKILIVISSPKTGGAEIILQSLSNYLINQKYHIEILYFFSISIFKNKNFILLNIINSIINLIYFTFRLCKHSNYFLCFSSQTITNSLLGLFRVFKILNTRYLIIRESTLIFSRFKDFELLKYKIAYYIGYRFSNLIICQSKRMLVELNKNIPVSKKWNLQVIQNPINLNRIKYHANFTIDPKYLNDPFIIAAGRLIKLKGFDILIEAFNYILPYYENYKLYIIGAGQEYESLMKKINTLNLTHKVKLLGYKENPLPFFKRAELCVVPSYIEGFPNVLLQMMALNDRIVVTNSTGNLNEIEGLFICEPGNIDELANQMRVALSVKDLGSLRNKFDEFLNKNTIENYFVKIQDHLKII